MGALLIDALVQSSGLPEDYTRKKLLALLSEKGLSASDLTLDELRDVLADLLQDVVAESLKRSPESPRG